MELYHLIRGTSILLVNAIFLVSDNPHLGGHDTQLYDHQ